MKKANVVTVIRVVGILVFVAAFFLPAVRDPGSVPGPGSRPLLGWSCALFAAASTGTILHWNTAQSTKEVVGSICLILSGWVNPLVFFYLTCSLWRRMVVIRRVFAVAIVLCYVATWVFFAQAPMVRLVGHYLWVLGGLLILAGELVGQRVSRPAS